MLWDFESELALQPDTRSEETQVFVRIVGNDALPREDRDASSPDIRVGNTLPSVTDVRSPMAPEASGNVVIDARLEDTDDDRANIRVCFNDGRGWRLARPSNTPQGDETPYFALIEQ